MQVEVKQIIKYIEDYLKVKDFEDHCVNGLQIEGVPTVSKIVTGVSLSQKLIGEAVKRNAKMIIVHHGIFGKHIPSPLQLKGVFKNRIKTLLENDINFAGFHLPLDAHPQIGNNASLCKLLGIKNIKPFTVGFIGDLAKEMKFSDFAELVNKKLATKSYVIAAGQKNIKRVGVISGGASRDYIKAKELGADTYLCGDICESVVEAVKENKMNFINAGHYNTEKLGIQNIGKLIAKKFGVKVEFVDIPNEI
jgi:dinuclear metal center YbgI/SA1388 family protein